MGEEKKGRKNINKKKNDRGQRDSTIGRVFALHTANLSLIAGILYGPPKLSRSNS